MRSSFFYIRLFMKSIPQDKKKRGAYTSPRLKSLSRYSRALKPHPQDLEKNKENRWGVTARKSLICDDFPSIWNPPLMEFPLYFTCFSATERATINSSSGFKS